MSVASAAKGCLTDCLKGADRQYHDFGELREKLAREEQLVRDDHCPPHIPCPLGSILVSILAFPIVLVRFSWLSVYYISQIVSSCFRLNHSKYTEYRRKRLAEDGSVFFSVFNWYVGYYMATSVAVALLWLVLMVVYPTIGVLHAVYEASLRTYEESDMWEESMNDGLRDMIGIGESDKEQCAETCAHCCVFGEWSLCRAVLAVGDFFLLTGMAEGLKRISSVHALHSNLLSICDGVLDTVNYVEDVAQKVDTSILPLERVLKKGASDVPKAARAAISADKSAKTNARLKRQCGQSDSAVSAENERPYRWVIALLSVVGGAAFWVVLLMHLRIVWR